MMDMLIVLLITQLGHESLSTNDPHVMVCSSLVVQAYTAFPGRTHHHGQDLLKSCLDITSELFFTHSSSNHNGQAVRQQLQRNKHQKTLTWKFVRFWKKIVEYNNSYIGSTYLRAVYLTVAHSEQVSLKIGWSGAAGRPGIALRICQK